MATPTGQSLLTQAQNRLQAYANALPTDALIDLLNEGKDEVWAVLKSLAEEYFVAQSQNTDSGQTNYFPNLTPGVRLYTLPSDFKEMKFAVTATTGYETTKFLYKDITDPDFQDAYKAANIPGTNGASTDYMYTIIGSNPAQLLIASFPQVTLALTLFYVQNIPDFEIDDQINSVLVPFQRKIVDYAVKKAMIGFQDPETWQMWREEWRADINTLDSEASPRNSADAVFVQDFTG